MDHCGALPYFSEMVGYDGPIYMTHPTKAICPILLVSLPIGTLQTYDDNSNAVILLHIVMASPGTHVSQLKKKSPKLKMLGPFNMYM